MNSESITMVVKKADGEEWNAIENNYEDLGLNFENGLMSDYKSCTNQCIFCFIDQMPPWYDGIRFEFQRYDDSRSVPSFRAIM